MGWFKSGDKVPNRYHHVIATVSLGVGILIFAFMPFILADKFILTASATTDSIFPTYGGGDIPARSNPKETMEAAHYICVDPVDSVGSQEVLTQAVLDRMGIPMQIADNNLYPLPPGQCETHSIQEGLAKMTTVWNTGTPNNPVVVYFPSGMVMVNNGIVVPSNMILRTTGPGPMVFNARNYAAGNETAVLHLSNSNSQLEGDKPLYLAVSTAGKQASLGHFTVLDFIGGLPAAVGLRASNTWASGVDIFGRPMADMAVDERDNALAGAVYIDADNTYFGRSLIRNVKPTSGLVRIRAGNNITVSQLSLDNPSGVKSNGYDGNMGFGVNIQPKNLGNATQSITGVSVENITVTHSIARFGSAVYMGSEGSAAVHDIVLHNIRVEGRADYGVGFYVLNAVTNIKLMNVAAQTAPENTDENLLQLGGLLYARCSSSLNPQVVTVAQSSYVGIGTPFYINNVPSLTVFGSVTAPAAGSLIATGPFPGIGDQNVIPQSVRLFRDIYQGSLVTPGSSMAGTTISTTAVLTADAMIDENFYLLYPRGQGPTREEAMQVLGDDVSLVASDLYGNVRWPANDPFRRSDHGAVQGEGTQQSPTPTATTGPGNSPTPTTTPTMTRTPTPTATGVVNASPTVTRTPIASTSPTATVTRFNIYLPSALKVKGP
ncbi:MAG: hypothetical protein HY326_02345 [Chloroflexi bacterium]|nr:hypothetical protein [Chloroflexota bacterium]